MYILSGSGEVWLQKLTPDSQVFRKIRLCAQYTITTLSSNWERGGGRLYDHIMSIIILTLLMTRAIHMISKKVKESGNNLILDLLTTL